MPKHLPISLKLLVPLFLAVVFFAFAPKAEAGNKYWYGGDGTWTDATNHWSENSGNSPAAATSTPTATDNVFFDANSGTGTTTLDTSPSVYNFDSTGFTGTLVGSVGSSYNFTVAGTVFTLGAGMAGLNTQGSSVTFTFTNTGTVNITTNGIQSGWGFNFNGGGIYHFEDNLTLKQTAILKIGSTGSKPDFLTHSVTVSLVGTSHSLGSSADPGTPYGFTGTRAFYNFTRTGTSALTDSLTLYVPIEVTNLTINGSATSSRLFVYSDTLGTARTITATSTSVSNADFRDITGAGVASWDLSAATGGSGNCGGNTMQALGTAAFTTATTTYWHVDSGSWSDVSKWFNSSNGLGGANRVPLCQDDVYFDGSSFDSGSKTITTDMPRWGKSVNFSGVTNNPALSIRINSSIYGSLTMGSMTLTTWLGVTTVTFEGRGAYTLTSNGLDWYSSYYKSIALNAPGGSLTLLDSLSVLALTVTAGTFSDGGNNVTLSSTGSNAIVTISGTATRSVIMGANGVATLWTLNGYYPIWVATTITNLTFTPNNSTIKMTGTRVDGYKGFLGGGLTYNNLWIAGSGSEFRITGSNIFNDIKINAGGTLKFTAGTISTTTTATLTGTAANPITIGSITAASHTLAKAGGGTITCTYCNITNSTATPASTWYANFSTNGGSNNGWTFNSAQIYRSVGPGKTTALAVGTSNAMTISGDTATFASALPNNVGVGDVIQYATSTGAVNSVAFIYGRNSSTSYIVKDVGGDTASSTSANTGWSIFRAYTSLALAETGTENTGINSGLRNFDTWSGGKNLASSTEIWNIAAYADAVDTTAVTIDGWTTSASNYIRIYTPYQTSEVGTSQRHSGKWDDTKYRLEVTNSTVLNIAESFVRIDGLQVKLINSSGSSSRGGIYFYPSIETLGLQISNNIVVGNITGGSSSYIGIWGDYLSGSSGTMKVWNNIVYSISATKMGVGLYFRTGGTWYIYNNTSYSNGTGIYTNNPPVAVAKNNIVQNCDDGFGDGNGWGAGSDYNVSDIAADAPGANSKNGVTVTFADAANKDFHLRVGDSAARGYGANLKNDANLAFDTDIDNENRPETGAWDIGADEVARTTQVNSPISGRFLDSSLVGYWSFDGANMGTTSATDLSGNSNTGWLLNGVKKTEGINGQALSFDGVDDYVQSTSVILTPSAFSAFGWFKRTGNSGGSGSNLFHRIVGGANGGGDNQVLVAQNGTSVFGQVYVGAYVSGTTMTISTPANFHQVGVIWDGTNIYTVLDGVISAPTSASGTLQTGTAKIVIGEYNSTNYIANGLIDEVRIYNRALAPSEVEGLYRAGASRLTVNAPPPSIANTSGSLVGYWSFDGQNTTWTSATAGTTNDLSGNNNTGTMTNMSQSTSPAIGISGQALSFDGSNDYVNAGTSPTIKITGDLTISAWVKAPVSLQGKNIIATYYTYEYDVTVWNNQVSFYHGNGTSNDVITQNSTLNIDQWNYIVITRDTSNKKIYIYKNGVLDVAAGGVSYTYAPASASHFVSIGSRGGGSAFFPGLIDDVRIYNRVLSANEVLQLYNLGARRAKIKQ